MQVQAGESRLFGATHRVETLREKQASFESKIVADEELESSTQESFERAQRRRNRLVGWRKICPKVGLGCTVAGITGMSLGVNMMSYSKTASMVALGLGLLGWAGVGACMYTIESSGQKQKRAQSEVDAKHMKAQLEGVQSRLQQNRSQQRILSEELKLAEAEQARRIQELAETRALEIGFTEETVEVGDFPLKRS